jgi:hypothetical protein
MTSNAIVNIIPDKFDATDFTRQVECIVSSVVSEASPPQFYVVKIDNWFGQKWLRYFPKLEDQNKHKNFRPFIPPFKPSKIKSELLFTLGELHRYEESQLSKSLHRELTSGPNRFSTSKLFSFPTDAVIFWWSGNSKSNGRGSLITSVPTPVGPESWYIELSEQKSWYPSVMKRISISQLERYMCKTSQSNSDPISSDSSRYTRPS